MIEKYFQKKVEKKLKKSWKKKSKFSKNRKCSIFETIRGIPVKKAPIIKKAPPFTPGSGKGEGFLIN